MIFAFCFQPEWNMIDMELPSFCSLQDRAVGTRLPQQYMHFYSLFCVELLLAEQNEGVTIIYTQTPRTSCKWELSLTPDEFYESFKWPRCTEPVSSVLKYHLWFWKQSGLHYSRFLYKCSCSTYLIWRRLIRFYLFYFFCTFMAWIPEGVNQCFKTSTESREIMKCLRMD